MSSPRLSGTTKRGERGLGLDVLATFEDHAGFDGVILGHPQWPYHLESTRRKSNPVPATRTEEGLTVFYVPDATVWSSAVARLRAFGANEVVNSNPYWTERGATFKDPDGNLIVLQNADWP